MTENTTTQNTVDTIDHTIVSLLPETMPHEVGVVAGRVIDAVTEREYALREAIIEEADKLGYGMEAADILNKVGVEARPEPEPEVAVEAESEGVEDKITGEQVMAKLSEILGTVNEIGARVSAVENAARRNGISL